LAARIIARATKSCGKAVVSNASSQPSTSRSRRPSASSWSDLDLPLHEGRDRRRSRDADEIRSLGRRAVTIHADVLPEADVRRMVESVRRELGPLKVAINVVGGVATAPKPFVDMTLEEWFIPASAWSTS